MSHKIEKETKVIETTHVVTLTLGMAAHGLWTDFSNVSGNSKLIKIQAHDENHGDGPDYEVVLTFLESVEKVEDDDAT